MRPAGRRRTVLPSPPLAYGKASPPTPGEATRSCPSRQWSHRRRCSVVCTPRPGPARRRRRRRDRAARQAAPGPARHVGARLRGAARGGATPPGRSRAAAGVKQGRRAGANESRAGDDERRGHRRSSARRRRGVEDGRSAVRRTVLWSSIGAARWLAELDAAWTFETCN
ncbi:hypothetical protein PVAP13_8NG195003 [Panicum virgatum]|uniref:Uncharacterized protein n=1 Tax=Panicum virgatum TaxID=38727 RepID=A0A8T0P912_PANVG|nr:hypothetical protein PVAP13_8NG195003 [Panicum virgatum]